MTSDLSLCPYAVNPVTRIAFPAPEQVSIDGEVFDLRLDDETRSVMKRDPHIYDAMWRLRNGCEFTTDAFTVFVYALQGGGWDGEIAPLLGAECEGGHDRMKTTVLRLLCEVAA